MKPDFSYQNISVHDISFGPEFSDSTSLGEHRTYSLIEIQPLRTYNLAASPRRNPRVFSDSRLINMDEKSCKKCGCGIEYDAIKNEVLSKITASSKDLPMDQLLSMFD